jgi:hypothetical protein
MGGNKKKLIRRFAVAIAAARYVKPSDTYPADEHDIWYEATKLAGAEPPLRNTVESLELRIRRAVAMLRDATRHDTAEGYMLPEDTVNDAVRILEGEQQ